MSCGLRWSCAHTEQLQISSYPSGECRCLHSAYDSSSVDHPCIGIACRMRRLELSTVANNFSHTFIIYYYVYSGVCIKSHLTFFIKNAMTSIFCSFRHFPFRYCTPHHLKNNTAWCAGSLTIPRLRHHTCLRAPLFTWHTEC